MRILLQDTRNLLYFSNNLFWTESPEAAFDFRTPEDLFAFVEQHSSRNVQVVVHSTEPALHEIVPLELTFPQPASGSTAQPN